jgi:hypothetical protein
VLHDYAFDQVGDVLAVVGDDLEDVEDLLPLHDGEGVAFRVEQVLNGGLISPVRLVLDAIDLDGVRVHGPLLGQGVQGRMQRVGRRRHRSRQLARGRTHPIDPVEPDDRGDVIDRVHDVVERRGQRVQIFPIERRDKRPVQPLDRVVRERVAAMLGVLDFVRDRPVRRIGRQHLLEQPGGRPDLVRHLVELIEELLVARNKAEAQTHTHLAGRKSSKQYVTKTRRRQSRV